MRRLAFAVALSASLLLIGCGGSSTVLEFKTTKSPSFVKHRFGAITCVSVDCGPYALTVTWGGISIASGTGFYIYKDGVQYDDVASQPYVFHGIDCGVSFAVGIAAHDGSGNQTATSTATYSSPSCGSVPANTAEPVVSGTVQTGQVLTADHGTWSGSPTSYGYQWQDCGTDGTGCSNITGATSSTYTVASGDAGHTIEALVTATNANGTSSAVGAPVVPLIDEFSGSSIDTNVWHVMDQQGDTSGNEQECYQPSEATVSGGFANLKAEHLSSFTCSSLTPDDAACTGACHTVSTTHSATYKSAALEEISTSFTFGTISARIKLGGVSGNDSSPWGAFWLLGKACQGPTSWLTGTPPSTGAFYCPWADDTQSAAEIDIAEDNTQGSTAVRMNLFNSAGTNHGCISGSVSDIHTNFHTYELDWTSGSMVFKIDGVTQSGCTVTGSSVPSHPMFAIVQLALQPVPVSSDFPFTEQVDWVHVSH